MTAQQTICRPGVTPMHMGAHIVGSRQAVAGMWDRHPDQVKRHCVPVACDVKTRAPLYDADESGLRLATLRRRIT